MSRVLALALTLAALPAAAQPTTQADPVARLDTALSFTDAQRALATALVQPENPAALWILAAALTPTLSADQRTALLAPPTRGGRGDVGGRGQRGDGQRGDGEPGVRERPRLDRDALAAVRGARNEALGLTEAQARQLDAAEADRAAMRAAFQGRDAAALPAPVADALTPAQQEVYRVHRALMRLTLMRLTRVRPGQ